MGVISVKLLTYGTPLGNVYFQGTIALLFSDMTAVIIYLDDILILGTNT